ncbi:MAG: endonuclease domain-containing protein [Gloeobacterales cyanobacterium]
MREHYTKKLIPRARNMRCSATDTERKLWYEFLRHLPFRVRRQCPLEGYIADFYIHEHRLIIEVDGFSHLTEEAQAYDAHRTAVLESLGLRVVRFTNEEVTHRFGSVCTQIHAILLSPEKAPLPGELSRRD